MTSVLIAEDSYTDRNLLKDFFETQGFEIAGEAINGMHAALMYEETKPDLVTLDILMDKRDGLIGIQKIMDLDEQARIIVVSSIRDKEKVVRALDLGAQAYVLKPFDEMKLKNTLHKLGFKGLAK